MSRMAKETEVLRIGGSRGHDHEPAQGLLPGDRPHQARPRPLLPGRRRRRAARRRRPADGAQAVRRRRRRAAVLPEARAGEHARLHPDRDAHLPVRPDRRRDRHRRRGRARLGRQPRLHRPQPASGPGRGPRPSRRAAGGPRPRAGRAVGRRSAHVALATREALEAVGLVGWPKTSGSRGIHINVRIEPRWTYPEVRRAALALARDVERRVPDLATSKWWKEERHGVFLDYNQNAKDRTVASAYSVRPAARRAGLDAADLGRGPDRRGGGVHDRHRARALRGDRATRAPGSTTRSGRSRRCSS